MITIIRLTNAEQNAIDEVTRIYKLELSMFIEECDGYDGSTAFEDTETGEIYNLTDGMSQILEAINCDDRELFHTLDEYTQEIFLELCKGLKLVD